MAIQRRLALLMLIAGSLLCIYILCGNLERPMTWSAAPLKPLQGLKQGFSSISPDTLESEDVISNDDPQAPTAHPTAPLEAVLWGNGPPSKTQTHIVAPHKPADVLDESRTGIGGLKPQERPPRPVAGTTEPPFIGDIYMTEDDPLQTNCSDSIQNQLTKTGFNERFLRNIPVVQWAKHVTPEQHLRLSRYPGAHGWGGVTYQTLLETLSVLNSSANSQLLDDWEDRSNGSECIRCAVVGNGGILKDSKKGVEIDGHDYVFRTNGAIIQGFERDVGSRTTHYTFSTNTLMNSMRSYAGVGYRGPPVSKETRYVFLPDHDRDYLLMKAAATHTRVGRGPELGKTPSKYFGEDVTAEKLKMYHPDFIRYLRNRFLRSNTLKTKYKDIYRPSTGAVMLLAALHSCDQVDAYGFMTPDYKNYSDHYYDSIYHPVGFFINHDLRMEMTLWQQLHKAGLIRLYMHL